MQCRLHIAETSDSRAHVCLFSLQAWSQSEAEGAWLKRLGSPEDTAAWIRQDPWLRLGRPLFKHLPEQLSGTELQCVHTQRRLL
jgi:hypothetical protein